MQTGTVTTGYHWLAPSATDQIHLPPRRLANRIFTATTAFSALNHSDFGKSSILSSRIFLVWSGSVCLAAVTQPSIDTRCVPPDKSSLVSLPSFITVPDWLMQMATIANVEIVLAHIYQFRTQ